jgi:Dynamin central region/Dynamin family
MYRTLVDLPGWIHSESKTQSKGDVQIVQSLIKEYIANERTILLAVISAKNDYANQVILQECRNIDKDGSRTLGVITKPDTLKTREAEKTWLDLALNKDIFFKLGWHLLRNRADDENDRSFRERNLEETSFFEQVGYKDLPAKIKGIESLRARLSRLLFTHLKKEIPKLRQELEQELDSVSGKLLAIGPKRGTILEQKLFLTDIFEQGHALLNNGVSGNYEDVYFRLIDEDEADSDLEMSNRLRATVQSQNMSFAEKMQQYGCKFFIEGDADVEAPELHDCESSDDMSDADSPSMLSREEAIEWIMNVLEMSRGRELPGLFNPLAIGQLFREQSCKWDNIARDHVEEVFASCKKFAYNTVCHAAPSEVAAKLVSHIVDPALVGSRKNAITELEQILEDTRDHPITYNHYFIDTLQNAQQSRLQEKFDEIAESCQSLYSDPSLPTHRLITPSKLKEESAKLFQRDMKKYAAEQALDAMQAYYKVVPLYIASIEGHTNISRMR